MGGIDQQVQEDLVEIAHKARYRRNLSKIRLHRGHVLELVGGHCQGVAQCRVQIGRGALAAIRMGESLHGLHDPRNPADAVQGRGN